MKSLRYILAAAAIAIGGASVSAIETPFDVTHRFATYNIRYFAEKNGDVGEKYWPERGKYVIQNITDYDFDVVGFQELTGLGGSGTMNPLTGRSQLEDMRAWLPEYTLLAWERDSNEKGKDYSYNGIAFKTAKYELLDSGCFWLRKDYSKPGDAWVAGAIHRLCGWVKLKVKETGEEFFFADTHCTYAPTIDGYMGAEILADVLSKIVGDYPMVLAGDFNMARDSHQRAYRQYMKYFYDSSLTAPVNVCLPEKNGQTHITATQFYTIDGGEFRGHEYDYLFYHNIVPLERHIITENYGRSVNPSDHLPVFIIAKLRAPEPPADIYVSAGARGGDGSISKPFGTISEGLAAAELGATVRVTAGVYTEQLVPSATVTIEGGYNADFTEVTGRTVVDGEGKRAPLVDVTGQYALSMSDFTLRNAAAPADTVGAMRYTGSRLVLERVDFENNVSGGFGGGLNAEGGRLVMKQCNFIGNSAAAQGGAAKISMVDEVTIYDCQFSDNTADTGAALYLVEYGKMNMFNTTIEGSTGTSDAAMIVNAGAESDVLCIYNSTFANNTSAAGASTIDANLNATGVLNIGHTTITGGKGAAAVVIKGGQSRVVNNIIAGNTPADIVVDASSNLAKEMNNIFTTDASATIKKAANDIYGADQASGMSAVEGLLDGHVAADGTFTAITTRPEGKTGVVYLRSTMFGEKKANVIGSFGRMLEAAFATDLDLDGKVGGYVATDQLGAERATNTVAGSVEYAEGAGVEDVAAESAVIVPLGAHSYAVAAKATVYSPAGAVVAVFAPGIADLNGLTPGMYILTAGGESAKIIR